MTGASLPPVRGPDRLDPDSRVAINLTPGVHHPGLVGHHVGAYENLVYIPQGQADLRMMLWGEPPPGQADDEFPRSPDHPLYAADKARFFVDASTWIDYMRGVDFTFGTRIHGNVASLLAGTPAHLLAHDSRTREIAEYFEIPHTRVDRLPAGIDASELLSRSSFTALRAGHARRFSTYTDCLDEHRVDHIYAGSADPLDLHARLAGLEPPPPVRPITAASRTELLQRLRWLYGQQHTRTGPLPLRLARAQRQLERSREREDRLSAELTDLRRTIGRDHDAAHAAVAEESRGSV